MLLWIGPCCSAELQQSPGERLPWQMLPRTAWTRGACGFRSPSEPPQALSWLLMAAAPLGGVPAAGLSAVQANCVLLVAPAISKLLSADMCWVGTSLPGL